MNLTDSARYKCYVDPDSAALLWRIGKGDKRALACLHSRYAAAIFGFVTHRVADGSIAEEICADVWLGCWRSAQAFRGDSKVLTWLLGIAGRQIHTHTRRKRLDTMPIDEIEVPAIASQDPAWIVETANQRQTLVDAIKALPSSLYEVVVLAWLHELPYEDISSVVGIPVGTVKSRVSRARELLRSRIGSSL